MGAESRNLKYQHGVGANSFIKLIPKKWLTLPIKKSNYITVTNEMFPPTTVK
jgi:hypothetical protein